MMKLLKVLLRKEFLLILRNKTILIISLIAPVLQFIILPLAANYEFKNINIGIVDHDHSSFTARLMSKVTGTGYFRALYNGTDPDAAYRLMEADKLDLILEIPRGFERRIVRENEASLFITINAINGTKAALGGNYLAAILNGFNKEIIVKLAPTYEDMINKKFIEPNYWFNPDNNYLLTLVPGILCILVTMIGGFLSALNIVSEKESGTIEQINVSPIGKAMFILSKLIPFFLIATFVFTVGLVLSKFIYGIGVNGSILVLYFAMMVYLLSVLGLGLLISTIVDTQHQAIFLMFFCMMIFMLMSGLFTPVSSMPVWAQQLSQIIPLKHMIEVIRLVMLKGATLGYILPQLSIMAILALILNGFAILNYRKTS